jgi:hypothetical protein
MRRPISRFIVPFIAAAALTPTAALAGDVTDGFDPSVDRAAWYWTKQVEAPAGGVGNLVPSPQTANSLPVALEGGEPEKTSAVFIDLGGRDVPPGATITRFDVSIVQESAVGETPGFEISEAAIRACLITGLWGEGQSQAMTTQPGYSDQTCIDGRRTQKDDKNTWTFDLTSIASDWDEPSFNRGFLLIGRSPDSSPAQTWQVNLKRPLKDDPATAENEYEATKDSLTLALSYTPPSNGADHSSKKLGSALYGGAPFVTAPAPPVNPSPSNVSPSTPVSSSVASAVPLATMPQIVWVLVPLGLILVGVMTWIVWEPDLTGRPLWMRSMGFEVRVPRRSTAGPSPDVASSTG